MKCKPTALIETHRESIINSSVQEIAQLAEPIGGEKISDQDLQYGNFVFTVPEVRLALAKLLSSENFIKAPRMCRLLRFLVERRVANAVRDISEYCIGIEVFDRNPSSYDTGEDPIVRVQVGRLREKLKAYYAAAGKDAELSISIPVGCYMPVIRRSGADIGDFEKNHLLAVSPLRCLSGLADDASFTECFGEQLSYQLFKEFGSKIVSPTFLQAQPATDGGASGWSARTGVSHILEGSVRVENDFIRASFRMIDAAAGCIAWAGQFDRTAAFSIDIQEDMAVEVCNALKQYFSGA